MTSRDRIRGMEDEKKPRLARTCNLDGSDPHYFVLPAPRLIARILDNPDGTAQAELTDYGKEVFGQFSEDFWKRANAQFDGMREQHRRRLEAEDAIDNPKQ